MSGVDRISTLPDAVLCHILSFMPTKMAVATSLVSKRWRPLWLSVTTVDLDDKGYMQTKESHLRFVRLAYAVLLFRDATQPILNFRLRCESSFFYDHCDIKLWVKSAIQRKVETIELSLPSHIKLPSGILTCASLVVLKLRGLKLRALTIDDIPTICLPVLKILHLDCVHFVKRLYLEMLLSRCPVLEDLQMKSLKPWLGDPPYVLSGFKIFPKLVRADISSAWIPISKFPNVEFLRTEVVDFTHPALPFHNLTHMELSVFCRAWYLLVGLLKCCPMLQILVINNKDGSDQGGLDSNNQPYPQSVPECLSSNLTACSLRNFRGIDADLRFARYIMQNARVLRTMTIRSNTSLNTEAKFQMLKNLSKVSRSSTICELLFE